MQKNFGIRKVQLSSECSVERVGGGICDGLEQIVLGRDGARVGLRVADQNRNRGPKKESKLGQIYQQLFRGKRRERKITDEEEEKEEDEKPDPLPVSVHPSYTGGAVPGPLLDLSHIHVPVEPGCVFAADIVTYMHSYQFHHPISTRLVTPTRRGMLVKFIYESFATSVLPTEVYYIAVNLIDITMAASNSINSTFDLELCAIAVLVIACKLEAQQRQFSHQVRAQYPAAELCRMELEVLRACNWQITRNTVMHFMRLLQGPLSLESGFWRIAKELSMLALVQSELAGLKPSLLGAVVMRLTTWVYFNKRDSWPADLYVFCQHDEKEFDLPTRHLVTLCRHVYKTPTNKYPMVTPTVLRRVCNSGQVADILSVTGLVMM